MTRSRHAQRGVATDVVGDPGGELEVEAVLLELLRHAAGHGPAPALPVTGPRFEGLWRRAGEEGLRGLLTERLLAERPADDGPGAARVDHRVRRARLDDFAHGSRLLAFLERLGSRLEERGLGVLVLKGAALIGPLYGGHVSRRPMSDLDLLPRPGGQAGVEVVLRELGLRPSATSWRGEGVEVDLHVDLVGSEFLPRRRDAFRFDAAELWSRSRPHGPGLRRLHEADLALHLSVHALKHAYRRWIWLLDLALLLRRVENPGELLSRARETGAERALAYAILALDHLEVLEARPWTRALPRPGRFETAYLVAVLERPQPFALGGAVTALSIPGWWRRLAYLAQLSWPSARMLRAAHGPGGEGRLRGRRLARLALPALWRLATLGVGPLGVTAPRRATGG